MSALAILDRAEALLAGGWVQKAAHRSVVEETGSGKDKVRKTRDCYCLGGALAKARAEIGAEEDPYRESFRAVLRALGRRPAGETETYAYIPAWNDAKERTQAEVVAAVQRAKGLLQ